MEAHRGDRPVKALSFAANNRLAFALAFCLSAVACLPAMAADQLESVCQQTGQDKRHLECDVRFVTPRDVNSITAKVVETSKSLPVSSLESYPSGGDLSAFLFLFDLGSDPTRSGSLSANIADAQRILSRAAPQDRFGVATYPGGGQGPAPSLDVVAEMGSDLNSVERRLAGLKPRSAASSTYLSSIEGIRLLKAFPAKRYALLVFTSGKSKGESYTLDNVVDEARKEHVAIFTFAVTDRLSDTRSVQPVMQIADLTNGRYFLAERANPHFAAADLDTTVKHLDNGGRVTVDLSGVASDQNVELAFATTGSPSPLIQRIPIRGLGAETSPTAYTVAAKPGDTAAATAAEQLASGWFGTVWNWIMANKIVSAIVGALIGIAVVLLLLALTAYRASRRRNPAMMPTLQPSRQETSRIRSGVAPTAVADDRGVPAALASLQPVPSGGSAHAVRAAMVTIGRAPDCDIRLSDDTVSAHHATITHKRDGSFELTDLGSRNGVRVNGERVDRRMVSNGDKIELGAAQFRFVLN